MERDFERDAPETLIIPSHLRKLWVFLSILLVLPIVLSPVVVVDISSHGENKPNLAFAICLGRFWCSASDLANLVCSPSSGVRRYILEYLAEESPENREFRFRLADEYLKAREGNVIYGKGRIIFDRNVEPQVRMELQRKAILTLKMLLENEPDNPKYLKAYAKALEDVPIPD